MNWLIKLKGRVRLKEPLNKYTSLKIGGPTSFFFEPRDVGDLKQCLRESKRNKIPCFAIGRGTNLLIDDSGFNGIVIKLTSPFFRRLSLNNNILTIGAGASVNGLVQYLSKTKLSGYEFLTGIPGSIGGALMMNAGVTVDSKRWNVGDLVYKIKVINKKGKILNLTRKDFKFGYRKSNLNRYIIIQAQLKLNTDKMTKQTKIIKDFISYRNKRLDFSKPSAGSIFRNPSIYLSAGSLIDRCGLKGRRCGGAMISKKHANFILNFNRATANDVVKLIEIVKKKVKKSFGIELKEEIRIVS